MVTDSWGCGRFYNIMNMNSWSTCPIIITNYYLPRMEPQLHSSVAKKAHYWLSAHHPVLLLWSWHPEQVLHIGNSHCLTNLRPLVRLVYTYYKLRTTQLQWFTLVQGASPMSHTIALLCALINTQYWRLECRPTPLNIRCTALLWHWCPRKKILI